MPRGDDAEWLIATRNRRRSRKDLHHTGQDLSSLSQVISTSENRHSSATCIATASTRLLTIAEKALAKLVGSSDLDRLKVHLQRLGHGGNQPVAALDVARGGAPGEAPPRMALVQQREEFLATPGRMASPSVEDRRYDLLRRLLRRAPRPARALLQAGRRLAKVALDLLVAGLARDAVVLAGLGDRQRVAQVVGDELRSLVHG